MFEPPGSERPRPRPGPEPLTIAMGGGRFDGGRDGAEAPRRHPDWIRARAAQRPELPGAQAPHARPHAQHGLRGGALPEHRGVLGAAHGHGHDPRRHVHAGLRLLRGEDRPARPGTTRTSRVASPRPCARWASSTSSSPASPATTCADGGAHIFAETIRALRREAPGHGRRGAHPGLQRSRTSRSGRSWRRGRTSSTTTSRPSSGSRSRSASAPATHRSLHVLEAAKAMALEIAGRPGTRAYEVEPHGRPRRDARGAQPDVPRTCERSTATSSRSASTCARPPGTCRSSATSIPTSSRR